MLYSNFYIYAFIFVSLFRLYKLCFLALNMVKYNTKSNSLMGTIKKLICPHWSQRMRNNELLRSFVCFQLIALHICNNSTTTLLHYCYTNTPLPLHQSYITTTPILHHYYSLTTLPLLRYYTKIPVLRVFYTTTTWPLYHCLILWHLLQCKSTLCTAINKITLPAVYTYLTPISAIKASIPTL